MKLIPDGISWTISNTNADSDLVVYVPEKQDSDISDLAFSPTDCWDGYDAGERCHPSLKEFLERKKLKIVHVFTNLINPNRLTIVVEDEQKNTDFIDV